MKTKRILTSLVAMSFALASCGSNPNTTTQASEATITVSDSHFWTSLTASPLIRWTDVSTGNYEVSIGTSPGATDILGWTNVGSSAYTTQSSLTFVDGVTHYANVRTVGSSIVTSSNGWVTRSTGSGAFAAATGLTATANPRDIKFADLNGDGFIDLVSADGSVGTAVSVFIATAAGTYSPAVQLATTLNPQNVELEDVTLDGDLDIIVATYSGSVHIFPGNGDGTFGARQDLAIAPSITALVVDDVNGDSDPDILVGSDQATDAFMVLLNSSGTFTTVGAGSYSIANNPKTMTSGDFNGDGDTDVATVSYGTHALGVFLGNGDGSFQARTDYATASAAYGVETGDFDADGDADLAVTNYDNNTVGVWINNGSGAFANSNNYAFTGAPHGLVIGDVNGDSYLDIVGASNTAAVVAGADTIGILLGNGDGTFGAKLEYAAGSRPMRVELADVDADGKLDIAAANGGAGAGAGTISLLLSQ